MEQTNRLETLTHDDQDSRALEPLALPKVSEDQPEAGEPATAGFDPLPDVPEGDDPELRNWRASVEAYVAMQTQPFTVDDVLEHGLHFTPGGWDRSEQMRVAAILRELGFDRQQRRIEGVRAQYWSSPTMVAFESRASEASQPATVAVRDEQRAEPAAVEQPRFLTETPNTIIGDAAAAPQLDEPRQTDLPRESARTRCATLRARHADVKMKLEGAQRDLQAAQDDRKRASLDALDGGTAAEGRYHRAVEREAQVRARLDQLSAALAQIDEDLPLAQREATAEARAEQCDKIRHAARLVETYGPRIEALLDELGKTVQNYLKDVNTVHRSAAFVSTGEPWLAMPSAEFLAHAVMGQLMRSSGVSLEFFLELTVQGLQNLLRHESPSEVVNYQLGNITARLVDNHWNCLTTLSDEEQQ
jgi:hypothetical protein